MRSLPARVFFAFGLRRFVAAAALVLVAAAPLAAHPLGNFTINHLTKLAISARQLHLHYVLDMAEIPTYQALRQVSPSGTLDPAQTERYGRSRAPGLLSQLQLSVDGAPTALVLDDAHARLRPGAGGLPTFYLTLDAHAALRAGAGTPRIQYRDATFPGRLGWHDVIVLPQTEPTHELTAYPNALLGSPRVTTGVDVTLARGGRTIVQPEIESGTQSGGVPSFGRTNQLSDMLRKGTSDPAFVVLTFLVAIVLGALHALEPGHGKTLLAVSLVGARATVKQASILAGSLTVAHTIGVLALGVAINLFKGYFVPETIYPWITLLSGSVIAVIGARAVQKQLSGRRRAPAFAHAHATVHAHSHSDPREHGHSHAHGAVHSHDHGSVHSHDHGTAHSHDHGHAGEYDHGHSDSHDDELAHARSHAIPGTAPLTFSGTVWAAMSGGVAPCPAALVVLLAAIALNEIEYGIFVIVAFSFGLAATLTGIGIAVVRGATWLQRRPQFDRVVRYGPLASAIVISTIGAVMVGQGFAQNGVAVSPVAISGAVALAIAVYALTRPLLGRQAKLA